MRFISSTGPPNDALERIRTQRPPTYNLIAGLASVRLRLYEEQEGRCAYCERRLPRPEVGAMARTRVEHFHPQSGSDGFTRACQERSGASDGDTATVSWLNLLLCCSGRGADGYTCDV